MKRSTHDDALDRRLRQALEPTAAETASLLRRARRGPAPRRPRRALKWAVTGLAVATLWVTLWAVSFFEPGGDPPTAEPAHVVLRLHVSHEPEGTLRLQHENGRVWLEDAGGNVVASAASTAKKTIPGGSS